MDTNLIISFNVAGWAWKLSNDKYRDRLIRICNHIKKGEGTPLVICLQEVQLGRKCKYLRVIREQFDGYEAVLPLNYSNEQHPQSIVNMILIKKENLIGLKKLQLPIKEKYRDNYRYNYIEISTTAGLFRIINLHMPMVCNNQGRPHWYQKSRKEFNKEMWRAVLKEAEKFNSWGRGVFAIIGDLNEAKSGPNIADLMFKYKFVDVDAKDKDTYFNHNFGSKKIDYMMVNMSSFNPESNLGLLNARIDSSTFSEHLISDHAMITAEIKAS